jgi:hypothetical protein
MAWGLEDIGQTSAKHRLDMGLRASAESVERLEGKIRKMTVSGVKISGKTRRRKRVRKHTVKI